MLRTRLLGIVVVVALMASVGWANALPVGASVNAYFTQNGSILSFENGTFGSEMNYKTAWFDDTDSNHYWSQASAHPHWYGYDLATLDLKYLTIEIDLGAVYNINEISVDWERNYFHTSGTGEMDLLLAGEDQVYALDEAKFVSYREWPAYVSGYVTDAKSYAAGTMTARYIKLTAREGYAIPMASRFNCISEIDLDVTPVPEPASMVLLGGGSILGLLRRRRK